MRISDWSSDVCSSVLDQAGRSRQTGALCWTCRRYGLRWRKPPPMPGRDLLSRGHDGGLILSASSCKPGKESPMRNLAQWLDEYSASHRNPTNKLRSEEHTSELQSLMRISYAVFCLKKKKTT